MNNKKAKQLRKISGGNTSEYDVTRINKQYMVMEPNGTTATKVFPFFLLTLKDTCSRKLYKELKKGYKAKTLNPSVTL